MQICSVKEVLLKISTGKDLCRNPFFTKVGDCAPLLNETPKQVFFCEFCEIFKNTYFVEHLLTAAVDTTLIL